MELNNFYNKELSPKEIFNSMRKNIFNFSPDIISINIQYLKLRPNLLNLIRQISSKMFFKSQTYFLSLYYLDIVFTSHNEKICDLNCNLTALACLLLSAKFCENDPNVPSLKYFTKIYNKIFFDKTAITAKDLFNSEVVTIKMLNHKLNYYTIYDFISFFFSYNILTKEQIKSLDNNFTMTNKKYIFNNNNFNENNAYICYKLKMIYQKIYKLSRYYLDILSENQICFKYSSLLLSAFIIKKSIEFILLQEKLYNNKNIDKALKERFIIKTNNYYKQMMKKYYDLDYEIIPEYQKLINDYDLNKLFYQNNKGFNMIYHNIKPNKAINISNKKGNYLYNNNIKKDKNNILEIKERNFSASKYNFHKLISSNNISTKIENFSNLNNFSGKNIPYINNYTIQENEKNYLNLTNLKRNLGIDNCQNNEYFENIDKNNDSNYKNYIFEKLNINSDKNINIIEKIANKENLYEKKNNKYNNSNENLYEINNPENKERYTLQTDHILNKNKTQNSKKTYCKKIIQNYKPKLINKKINININALQISNKYKFDNENIYPGTKRSLDFFSTERKNNKFISKNEFKTEIKKPINKKFNDKNFKINLIKDFKEKTYSSNKKERIKENSPSNTLYITKKINEEIFSSTSYINKTSIKNKKFDSRISKSLNKFENLLKRRINNINKIENIQLKLKYNEQQNGNEIRSFLNDSDKFKDYNIFTNRLTSSSKEIGNLLIMNSKFERNKEGIPKNKNKIFFTDNTFSGDENPNKLNSDINLNEYIKSKKLCVKNNKFNYEIKSKLKKNINNNMSNYREYISKFDENLYKKNSSTIVINNNININFGNKYTNEYKDSKIHGQNSISSLLQKIPSKF